MTSNEAEQSARIIEDIFENEDNISPTTAVRVFKLIGRLLSANEYCNKESNRD